MFSVAYVLLPFDDARPADAIRASLARFKRGGRGDVPDEWLGFHDETPGLRHAHEARFTFTAPENGGLQTTGDVEHAHYLDHTRLTGALRRQPARHWTVRFADSMNLDEFAERFAIPLERHPATGQYGQWLNRLGHWDWWDLGGRFDGHIIGERQDNTRRTASELTSGDSPGRRLLANIDRVLHDALGQETPPELSTSSDRNIELVATLAGDARANRPHAFPGVLVLPPRSAPDEQRWLHNWPEVGPAPALSGLGLPADAGWSRVVRTAYARFPDHWAACVAFHL